MTQYYSKTKDETVNINDMHHQHVWYAFKKLCDRLETLALTQTIWDDAFNPAKQSFTKLEKYSIKADEDQVFVDNDNSEFVRKDVYELMFDKATRQDCTIEHLLNENSKLKKKFDNAISELFEDSKLKRNANSKMVLKLEKEISRLKEQNEEYKKHCNNSVSIDVYENLQKAFNRLFNDQKHIGHRYVFSNIPNTEEGRQTVHKLRKWLNKDTYNMRVRGQYLDKTKLSEGESWRTYDDGQPLSKSRCIRLYIDKKKESA